ncbi:MAG: LptF/LptG family permease [Treponema sp.]|jgi:lipopolysaccharide export system permease protein|nr:LptF/LptG family permease [Treponema sp.]
MTLDRYLVKQFLPMFIVAVSMFVLLLILVDLFANLWRYLNYEVSLIEILHVSLLYLPKSFSYAMPIGLLFAGAYTLGDLYGRNELTIVFASGIPFWRFSMPLMLIGLFASLFAFFFEDQIVIPTLKAKNDLSRTLLHESNRESNSDIVIKANSGRLIYSVDYFDVSAVTLNGISIIEQGDDGSFQSLIRAPRAAWSGEYWVFSNALRYQWDDDFMRVSPLPETDIYRETPDTFRRSAVNVEELSAKDAVLLIEDLKTAGLPFIGALADYYHRFSFPCVSLVVMILSISMGSKFKKNILLMSLGSSLGSSVLFYVTDMITMMMARLGYILPVVGAWLPVLLFVVAGVVLLANTKT